MNYRQKGYTQVAASAKAGFSERSARNIQNRDHKPATNKRTWRTREDPFEEVWSKELVPLLEKEPNLQARTLLEYLQQKYPEKYPDNKLRTLERRVCQWKAKYGPEKEIIFRQNHPPGWQGLSDFTVANTLKITINHKPFDHLLYHYRLRYSGWEYARVVLGGESYPALAEGLQKALHQCGGVPKTHRTDSLSASYKNLNKKQKEDLTERYQQFCEDYQMEPTRNNKGVSHENGSVESSHRHLKNRLEQALLLRGNRDFASIDEYRKFVQKAVSAHNARIHKEYLEELSHLTPLPTRKSVDYDEEQVKVSTSSTIQVKSVTYSVPSRLIKKILKVHIYDDKLECFFGGELIITLERIRRKKTHVSQIDYRHIIGQLNRKPNAFKNYVHKEKCFPTLAFRQIWEYLNKKLGEHKACKEYVGILNLAAKDDNEEIVDQYLEKCLMANMMPTIKEARSLFPKVLEDLPKIDESVASLESYEELFVEGGNL